MTKSNVSHIEKKKSNLKSFRIKFEGAYFSSYKELCNKYNVNYTTFMVRKQKGWDIKECVYGKSKINKNKTEIIKRDSELSNDTLLGIEVKKVIKYEDKYYSSYEELCEAYHIDYGIFTKRMNMGWYIDDCVYGRTSDDKGEGIEYQGTVYSSFRKLCEKYNRSPQEVFYKINTLGWSLGKALKHNELKQVL